jgi:Kdo2-lipid IVA lauroyltransferase/acyltransferase
VRHRLEYAAVLTAIFIVKRLPWVVVRALGTMLGLTFYGLDRTHRRVAISNLTAAFPTRSSRECRAIARGVFAHFGRVLLELLKFSTLRPDQMRRLVEFEGDERARQAYSLGNGVIFLTGHFGFWELNGIVHALELGPIGLLARPLDNPYLNSVLERVRRCTGNTIIYRRGAIRRIMRELRANRGVAMLIDQHIHTPDAVSVDFFNRPAATSSSVASLALRTGAPVIPVLAVPAPGGRYRMIYEHPVEPPSGDSPEAIRDFTQRCTDVLEMYVRRYPDLWLWMHRRWRDNGVAAEHVPGMFPRASGEGEADAVEPESEQI